MGMLMKSYLIIILSALVIGLAFQVQNFVDARVDTGKNQTLASKVNVSKIKISDSNLKIELVTDGLNNATRISFLGPNDILILEKDTGTVNRFVNGSLQSVPLLDLNVATKGERGLLGVAVSHGQKINAPKTYVFLYLTESKVDGGDAIGNRLFRYELVNNKLINPKLLLDLPANPGPLHNGGAITIGPDNNIYIPIGDLDNIYNKEYYGTQAQNIANDTTPDGRAGILRFTQDGEVVGKGILGDKYPLNLYYAYGIRNSYGLDFDPLTGKLWDTENGPEYGDEINLVEPGFNSGWIKVQGIWKVNGTLLQRGVVENHAKKLTFDFLGKGKYSDPELTWKTSRVGLTSIAFFSSEKLGKEYENDLFVGDFHDHRVYHFNLNKDRTKLSLDGPIHDKVVNKKEELKREIFADRFDSGITDIKIGPDGYLYILTHGQDGALYRVVS